MPQIVLEPVYKLSKRLSVGGGRSGGTGVYVGVHEDSEHRPTPNHSLLGNL